MPPCGVSCTTPSSPTPWASATARGGARPWHGPSTRLQALYKHELVVLIKGAACGSVGKDDDEAAVVGASAAVVKHVDKDRRDHLRVWLEGLVGIVDPDDLDNFDGILHLNGLCWKARVPVISLCCLYRACPWLACPPAPYVWMCHRCTGLPQADEQGLSDHEFSLRVAGAAALHVSHYRSRPYLCLRLCHPPNHLPTLPLPPHHPTI